MTTMRSPTRIDSTPRGRISPPSRMMLATFESGGNLRVLERRADDVRARALLDVELDDLHLPLCEDVGLPRGRDADRRRDRVRRLELGRDDEVDVELALSPQLEVFDVRRADDRLCARCELSDEHRGDDVRLVLRRTRDDEVRVRDARVVEGRTAGAVALDGHDVEAIRQRGQPRGVDVEHRHRVLVVKRLDDRRTDLACADDEDPHPQAGG